ncbi:MAG: hypothetical protein RIM83_15915 [Allomuricauda sp.]
MKRLGFVTLLLFGCSNFVWAQDPDENSNLEKATFFEQLALKDADYEQSLVLSNEKDELDFWEDQKRYEQDLMKSDEAAYRSYMKAKKEAYHEHFQSCSNVCNHSKQNLKRAEEYLSSPQEDYTTNEIVANSFNCGNE